MLSHAGASSIWPHWSLRVEYKLTGSLHIGHLPLRIRAPTSLEPRERVKQWVQNVCEHVVTHSSDPSFSLRQMGHSAESAIVRLMKFPPGAKIELQRKG